MRVPRPERGPHLDVLADQPPEEVVDRGHGLVEPEHLRLEHLAAAEGEKLRSEFRGPVGRAPDLLGGVMVALLGPVALEDQLAVARDRGQEVVEVVRDAAGQPADRLQLLRLAEILLEAVALGHVLDLGDEVERVVVRVPDEGDGEEHRDEVALAVDIALLQLVPARLAREEPAHVGEVGLEVVRMRDVLEHAREQLVLGVADDLAEGPVDAAASGRPWTRSPCRSARCRTRFGTAPRSAPAPRRAVSRA